MTDLGPRGLFDRLARELGVVEYRVADNSLVPRDLVVAAVEALGLEQDVDLNTPAHAILAEVFDTVGSAAGGAALARADLPGTVDALTAALDRFSAPRPLLLRAALSPAPTPPAASKLEAVNKISALTGSGPQTLGPGSKEHRSVLEDLHRGLGWGEAPGHLSKPALGERIAVRLGGAWDRRCWSTGYTITLEGLNRLLSLAAAHLTGRGAPTPAGEARVILAHLAQEVRRNFPPGQQSWPGRWAVARMLGAGFAHARQTEWPGWFFEFLALPSLMEAFGGGPHRVGRVTFDYRANHVWDLKTHAGGGALLLNDAEAIDRVVADHGGVGFVVLRGSAGYDGEHEFWRWHNTIRRGPEHAALPRSPSSRRLKTSFTPTHLEALWLEAAALGGQGSVRFFHQGRQADGSLRRPKYQLPAGAGVSLARVDLG